ncbi:alpha/beta fold hydrolase [Flavihumibacter sp. UBA7668]|uniref:alpha/beta fold hydrolase n=1 Tax=Flavihumibacter sp. UBA7668 TaxID=1946542 RepID=UPI0025C515CC|nr:alpha/beta hydrolase [Flavihumibacter sp. UBA7668]
MKIQDGIIERDGFKLSYRIEGTGEPVLVIGSTLFYQRWFSPKLKENLQLIYLDHRGFTPPPESSGTTEDLYSLDRITDDMEALRLYLGLEKWWVAGHSGHGYMAFEYAKKYNDQVYGLILIAMSPSLSTENHAIADLHFDTLAEPERILQFQKNMEELPALIEAGPDQSFLLYNLALAPKSWRNSETDVRFFWNGVYTNMPAIDYLWGIVFRDIEITKELEDFYTPVWLALGKYDFVAGPREQWTAISKQFPDLTIELFEESAHNPPYEEAELFNEKLLAWMDLYK